MAIREIRWAYTPLPEAHWRQAVQVCRLRAQFCTQRSSGAAYETSPAEEQVKDTPHEQQESDKIIFLNKTKISKIG